MKSNHRTPFRVLIFVALVAPTFGQAIERVSVGPGGAEANSSSSGASVSWGGRFVAFSSSANNLVPDDTNEKPDCFVRDMQTGMTERVSLGVMGHGVEWFCGQPSVSDNGRYVAVTGGWTNPSDWDIFYRDRLTGTTECISLDLNGQVASGDYHATMRPLISANGRYVTFYSDKLNLSDSPPSNDPGWYQIAHVYVRDVWAGKTTCVSVTPSGYQGDDNSYFHSMSPDGRFVAFQSVATNLVPGWDGSPADVIYVRDMRIGKTVGVARGIRPSISADGRYVAYYDLPYDQPPYHSRVFVRDMLLGGTRRVGQGNANFFEPRISPNGRYVIYSSAATDILGGDPYTWTDVFRWDRRTDQTRIVSANAAGVLGDGDSWGSCVLFDGRVLFDSDSSNLVTGDTNGAQDVFLKSP